MSAKTKTAKSAETTEAPASAGKGKVFSVSAKKGPLETVQRTVAIKDCEGENFTAETCETMLAKGDVIFSDEYYYSENADKLKKWTLLEAPPEVIETETPAPELPLEATPEAEWKPENLEVAVNVKTGAMAEVHVDGDKTTVHYKDGKGKDKSEAYNAKKWRKATDEEFFAFGNTETGLVKAGDQALAAGDPNGEPINGEIVLEPLNKTERKKLEKLEQAYEEVDGVERQIPFQKGVILNEIRNGRLFRETHKTFGEYALERFGITREYAQNLAQISGIPDLAAEALGGESVNMSVNTANELMRDSNKMVKALGIGKVEVEAVAPILRNTLAVMADVAPRNEAGDIELTPRFVNSFNAVLAQHLTDGVVEIDGKQMTVKEAGEKGLLSHSLREQVLTSAAESIRTNAATIVNEYKKAEAEAEAGIANGGGDDDGNGAEENYYRGKVPTLDSVCSKHGETEILTISAGKVITRCGCKWHIDAKSGSLVAYEVNDKRVKPKA